MFIDSHAHLFSEKYDELTPEILIKNALDQKVEKIVNLASGIGLNGILRVLEAGQKYSELFQVAGFHPHEAGKISTSDLAAFEKMLASGKLPVIGEIGLDFHYNFSTPSEQLRVFEEQLELAEKYERKIVIHCREAHHELKALLKRYSGLKAVIHCFTGTFEDAADYLERGYLLSIPGIITFKKNGDLEKIVSAFSLENFLIETDSPYLAPHPFRGKHNQPAYLPLIAAKIAGIKGVSLEKVAEITSENCRTFFGF